MLAYFKPQLFYRRQVVWASESNTPNPMNSTNVGYPVASAQAVIVTPTGYPNSRPPQPQVAMAYPAPYSTETRNMWEHPYSVIPVIAWYSSVINGDEKYNLLHEPSVFPTNRWNIAYIKFWYILQVVFFLYFELSIFILMWSNIKNHANKRRPHSVYNVLFRKLSVLFIFTETILLFYKDQR